MGDVLLAEGDVERTNIADERKFERAATLYRSELLTYFLRVTGDYTLSEDLTQETLLKAFEHRSDYDSSQQATVLRWFYYIAGEVHRDYGRKRGRGLMFLSQVSDTIAAQDGSDSILEKVFDIGQIVEGGKPFEMVEKSLWGEMYRQVSEVPVEQRQAFMLRHAFGLNYPDIAEMTNTTSGTAHYRAERGLRFIKEIDGIEEIAEAYLGYKLV